MALSIPKTCRAVVIEKPGAPWAIKEVPIEDPKQGEVLVKVHACGVCHSDSFLQQGAFGPMASFPRIPGHELIGTVVAVGPGEKKWKVGDKVGGPWHGAHDGLCKACNRGLYQMCDNELVNGVSRNGGYAEYCTLRSEATVRIPKDADPAEYAPLLCAGVTVFNGIRNMNIVPGDTVAVQGLGGLGHLAIQYARRMGYRTVALSTSSSKKDFAFQLGATDYIDTSKEDATEALQKMGGASLIVVTAPNPKIMGPLVKACGPLGKVLILAPVGEVPVDTVAMIVKGSSVHGWPSGHALDCEEAISFAEHQGVKCMIEKFPLDKVEDAVKHMESGKARFRSVIVMD
ncbi:alcohol dehydrogenase [Lindgomyces ingoldianus]|uniref:Alcohol dehydrogenase n=1 Tax=Lindgomyces ingoldianus TaxID=673940 RepID=A0ACB6R8W0_9PLEO|nr:alcohol dehydrogenase [Lindgomyces ingoldianus]KAF2475180.1 alcohol dehydrogenase [Lindgomyces ingoldianus]